MRKKKTVIKAARAVPPTRAPLRLIVGIIVLFVGIAAWKTVATHSSNANSIVAASSPVPLPPSTNFIPTIPNTSDNGAEKFTWPDGGTEPFRGEKGTTWEGGFRVPCVARWPGVIKPNTIINDIASHEDWMPTFLAAAGVPDVKEQLLKGYKAVIRRSRFTSMRLT